MILDIKKDKKTLKKAFYAESKSIPSKPLFKAPLSKFRNRIKPQSK